MVILTLAVIMGMLCAKAQGTVYVFTPSYDNLECTMTINDGEVIDIRGPFEKFKSFVGEPLKHYHAAVKKFILKEGYKLIKTNFAWSFPAQGINRSIPSEISLNLTNGSVHYLSIKNGKIREITEKDGQKFLTDDKYKALPDYNEDSDL